MLRLPRSKINRMKTRASNRAFVPAHDHGDLDDPKSGDMPIQGAQKPAPDDPLAIDYKAHPELYKVLKGEQNVFKTDPYSEELKPLWRFKNEAVAKESSKALWQRFKGYRSVLKST